MFESGLWLPTVRAQSSKRAQTGFNFVAFFRNVALGHKRPAAMLRKGCWEDVNDFSNPKTPSFAASGPRHHPQHGRNPGQVCLDRSGFAAPSSHRAPRA